MLAFLLMLCDEHDGALIEHLYQTYHRSVWSYVKAKIDQMNVPDPEGATEDIVQNVFFKITRSVRRIRTDLGESAVRAYVYAIVTHEISNYAGQEYLWRECVSYETCSTESEDDFIAQLPLRETYAKVVSAIERLDDIYRYTLLLRFVHEMEVKDIAATMGVSVQTVYTRLTRGKKILLEMLKKEGICDV